MPRLLQGKRERVYVEFRDREANLLNVDSATASVYDDNGDIVTDLGGTALLNRPLSLTRTGVYSLAVQFAAAATPGNYYLWAEGTIQNATITPDYPIEIALLVANFIPTTTLAPLHYVKTILRVEDTSEDTYLYDLLLAADIRVKDYCKRSFWIATFTDNCSGRGGNSIIVTEYPVTTVTSVTDDGALKDPDDYVWTADGFIVLLADAEFSNVENGVVVVYVAGYAAIPEDLQLAVAQLVDYWRRMSGRGGLRSERIGDDYTYTRDSESLKDGLPAEVRSTLKNYRRLS